ncbi:MAG TPA: SAM-dependent methyltransferase [Terriglobales bacterium]|nr:SAM-dependent methyltransferase [Terriglobales bacterium]
MTVSPIGWVHSREEGPREDFWGGVVSEIRLDETQFSPAALEGLSEFSHVEVLFHLHNVSEKVVIRGRRHPRGETRWPEVGIFAQRAKARPNRIAATVCRLLAVQGLSLTVKGLDALNGSPVLDIKPVFAEFLPDKAEIRQAAWSHEMMAKYF